jgi:YesN/AraC family two-component response regulator
MSSFAARMPHVLIVDDDGVALGLFRRFFAAAGFEVSVAVNGCDALARVTQEKTDALVLDLCLPEMSDLDVLAALRQTGLGLPVVVISGFGGLEDGAKAIKLGAAEVLSKPLDVCRLVTIVLSLVELPATAVRRDRALATASVPPGVGLETMSRLDETSRTRDEQLFSAARKVIDLRVDDPHLDLATVATTLGVSRWRLSRAFSASAADFRTCVRNARMRRAGSRFCDQQTASVKEVAIDSGYRHATDFTRHFKAHWGITPAEFRRSLWPRKQER